MAACRSGVVCILSAYVGARARAAFPRACARSCLSPSHDGLDVLALRPVTGVTEGVHLSLLFLCVCVCSWV